MSFCYMVSLHKRGLYTRITGGQPAQGFRIFPVGRQVAARSRRPQRASSGGGCAAAPGCGMGDILVEDVRTKVELVPTIAEADVELVFDPPWNHSMMSEAAKLETGML